MLNAERSALLLDLLRRDGKVVAKTVALDWGISEDTVRRDLRDLAAAGLCQRVYGGALPMSPAIATYAARARIEPESKQRVAAAAAALIQPGATVLIDGGTTTLAVVQALSAKLRCTVITHSPTIASALLDHELIEVLMLGGRLYKHSAVTCGATAVEAAQSISADLFLLGVTGVHPVAGLTTGDSEEAAMKRALSARSAETYVLASAEKIGTASRYTVLPLDRVAAIVTDARTDDRMIGELTAAGARIVHTG